MDLDTVDLRALLALERTRHFGRAAVAQGITQQGLSRRIARLERQVGMELVDRTDRRAVRLTLDGTRVADAARRILAVLAGPPFRAEPDAAETGVDVMSGMLATTAWALRAERSAGFALRTVQRPPGTTADHLVSRGEARFAFGRAGAVPAPWPADLRMAPILLEPVGLLTPLHHPWAERGQVAFAELRGAPLWFPMAAAPAEWREWVDLFADASGAQVLQGGATHGYTQWAQDVATGARPPSLFGEAMTPAPPDTTVVPVVDPTPVFAWSLFWSAARTVAADVEAFREAIGFTGTVSVPPGAWLPEPDRAVLGSL